MRNWRKLFYSSALVMNTTPDEKFDPRELQMGTVEEQEHGVTSEEAKSIAKDHLIRDPHYYTKLKQYVETKSSSKLTQRGRRVNSMRGYLRCPECGHEGMEEDFEADEEEDNCVICPRCGRPFEKETGDPFFSGEEF